MVKDRRHNADDVAHEPIEVDNLTKPVVAAIGKKKRAPSVGSKSLETTRRFFCRQCSFIVMSVLAFLTAVTYLCAESKGAIQIFDTFLNITSRLLNSELRRIELLESSLDENNASHVD